MSDYTDAELETGRAIVREWSESQGRGLALSIVIAKALASARASERERCAAVALATPVFSEGTAEGAAYAVLCNGILRAAAKRIRNGAPHE